MTHPKSQSIRPLRRAVRVAALPAAPLHAKRGGFVGDADFSADHKDPTERPAEPVNSELLRRAEALKVELPGMLTETVIRVREFFLRDVFASEFAVESGLRDADEVIAAAFGERPASSPYTTRLRAMASSAILARSVFRLSDILGLDARSAALFLQAQLTQMAPGTKQPDLVPRLREALDQLLAEIPQDDLKPHPHPKAGAKNGNNRR